MKERDKERKTKKERERERHTKRETGLYPERLISKPKENQKE